LQRIRRESGWSLRDVCGMIPTLVGMSVNRAKEAVGPNV
jgi:hypothetical protein